MKKRILLVALMVALLVCLFAISVSAAEVLNEGNPLITSTSDAFATGDQINYITGLANEIYFNGTSSQNGKTLSLEQRMVLKNDDGTYSTFPSAYLFNISKDNDKRAHRFQYLDTTLINAVTGQNYEAADLIRLEIPEGITDIHHDDRNSYARLGMNDSKDLKAANLKYLCFPSTCDVITLGDFARGITALEEVDFSKMTNPYKFSMSSAFYGCTSLTKVTFPETFNSDNGSISDCKITDYMFYQCPITTLTIPKEITNIGKHTFRYSGLTSFDISNTVVTEIGEYAFENCDSLVTIKLPTTVKKFNACSFANNEALAFVDFGNNQNVFEMPSWGVFYNCVSLKAISLPAKTKTIPDRGFSNCKALTAVYLGENLEAIYGNKGDNAGDGPAFAYNTLMYFVQKPFSVTKDDGSFYSASEFVPPEKPTVYYFPSTLKQIVNSGNRNEMFRLYDFTYTYTTTTVIDETTGKEKTLYVLNIDENGYPVISYGNNNIPNYNTNVLVKDKDGNVITNEYFYLFEYERDENGDLILTEVKESNKYYMRPTIKRDAEGNIVYRLDENGERIKIYDSKGIPVRAMDEEGIVGTGGNSDRGIVGCTNLNSILVFPEGFTGYYDGTQSRDENQRGDILGDGMIAKCATAENPITLVFMGRIDRISMDRKSGYTSYMTYMFANPANTGFENTKIGTWYNVTDSSYSNQNEMYVIFCHAQGGAQKYKINFAKSEKLNTYPVLSPTRVDVASDSLHINDVRNDAPRSTDATCLVGAKLFDVCFCGTECNVSWDLNNPATGHKYNFNTITSITYADYTKDGVFSCGCDNEGCEGVKNEVVKDSYLFTYLGYSIKDGDVCVGYSINAEFISYYKTLRQDEFTYGVLGTVIDVDANGDTLEGQTNPLASGYTDAVVKAPLADKADIVSVDFIIRGEFDTNEAHANALLAMNMYVIDGESTYYIWDNVEIVDEEEVVNGTQSVVNYKSYAIVSVS